MSSPEFCVINDIKLVPLSKHASSDRGAAGGKRQRKSITLEEKLYVIIRYEHNKHTADIVNAMKISVTDLKNHRKRTDKIKESCKIAMRKMASMTTQIRMLIMMIFERILALIGA
jgi:hypothetical protein